MSLSQKQIGHITMFFVATIFAINIPVGKYLLSGYISPFGYTMARVLFAAIIFWVVSLFTKDVPVNLKDHRLFLFGALFGVVFNQGLFVYGLGHTSPVDASIITTSSPLFAMIIAALILKEPITGQKVLGVFIGIAGALLLIYTGHTGEISLDANMMGNLIIIGGSFSYAFYLVITRPLSTKYSSITIMKWIFLYSSIILTPFFHKDLIEADLFRQTDIIPFILLAFVLFFATFVTYMLIPVAQKRIRPTTISMYNNIQPLIASFIAIMLGQDTFSGWKVISGILVLGGVYLVTQSKSKADLEAEKAITG